MQFVGNTTLRLSSVCIQKKFFFLKIVGFLAHFAFLPMNCVVLSKNVNDGWENSQRDRCRFFSGQHDAELLTSFSTLSDRISGIDCFDSAMKTPARAKCSM